jgi:hypothetical protein
LIARSATGMATSLLRTQEEDIRCHQYNRTAVQIT